MFVRRLLRTSTQVKSLRFTAAYAHHQHYYGASLLLLRHRFFSSIQPKQNGIRILYASQTGTAQLFANQLAEGLEDEGLEDVTVQGLDEEPPNEILTPGHLHLLLTSCTGKGEPPDNARKFYDWVMKDPSAKLSDDINFAVFGLGNEKAHSNNYNVIGKQLDARLVELGGNRVKDLGLGDDGQCIEGDFDEWMDEISKVITKTSSTLSKDGEESQPHAECPASKKHHIINLDPSQNDAVRRDLFHLTGSNRFYAEKTSKLKVIGNQLLASDAGESALHEIRVSLGCDYANRDSKTLSYTTGDHFLVYPRNSEAIVNAYVDMLDVDPHAIVSENNNNNESYPYPTGITIVETLSHCVDLGALPSPGFSRMILGRKELDYANEIANPRRTVIDLCHQAGTQLSLEDLLYNAVPMRPRYYSIASSSIKCPDEILLVFRPVHYMTSKGYLREGVCTSYLCHKGALQKGSHDLACLPALINPNPSFRLPGDPETPVMFIGGGCGVAPIRAFIEERVAQAKYHDMGPSTLFMGYRNPQDEVLVGLVQEALKKGALTESEIAYSSGCNMPEQRQMQVSDLIRLKSDNVWNHIQDGGHVYLCGGARTFGVAIESALLDIFQEQGEMDFDDALKYFRDLVDTGRLAEDLAN